MSHFKCMTTEPGCLPKETEEVTFQKLPQAIRVMIKQIGQRMRAVEAEIRKENEHKKELKFENEEDSQKALCIFENELSDDDHLDFGVERRRRGFEKNIDNLLRLQLQESKEFDLHGKHDMDKHDGEKVKNKFDRRIYELDTFKSILSKVKGFDFRYQNQKDTMDVEGDTSASMDTETSFQEEPTDDLTPQAIRQLE